MDNTEQQLQKDSFSLFKVVAWIGIVGNGLVGIVALYFMAAGLMGTGFMMDAENSSTVYAILFLLGVTLLCIAVIIGLTRMLKGDVLGRRIFMYANFIWIAMTFVVLRDAGFYQLGVFSGLFTLVILFLSRQDSNQLSQ